VKLRCVRCGTEFKLPAEAVGSVQCPTCGAKYRRGGDPTGTLTTARAKPAEPPTTLISRVAPPAPPVQEPPPAVAAPVRAAEPSAAPAPGATLGVATPVAEPSFAEGQVLGGRYRIEKYLAQGGMGEVYEAFDQELQVDVALKTVQPRVAQDDLAVERFKREIQLARRVTHPNVCRIFDVGYHYLPDGQRVVFLTMELLLGETLATRLRRAGRMTGEQALPILRQVAAGLSAAHKAGIVHRDFKSENVFLVPDASEPGGMRAVVADFGIARAAEDRDSHLTSTGGVIGTPAYMSPEQLEGSEVTAATDIYAFGLVMYEMVTGTLPFRGDTALATAVKRLTEPPRPPHELVPDLDPRFDAVILRCLERRPEDRFATATEAVQALDPPLQTRVLQPMRAVVAPRGERRQRWIAAGLALLLLIAVVSAVLRVRARREAGSRIDAPRRSVAVLGFRNVTGRPDEAWISTGLAEMLNTELAAGDRLRLISGENVARAKIELGLQDTDSLAADTLAKVRRVLGADYVLLGSYTALGRDAGGKLRLDLRLQDAAAGETLQPVAADGTEAALFDLVKQAGQELRARLGAKGGASTGGWWAPERWSPEATRLYSEGIARLRAFDAQGARELLEQAVAADPKSPLARSALAGALSALGYDARAAEEAKRAFDLSADLPREQRLEVEGRYRETAHDFAKAAEIYGALFDFYPDSLDYGLRLAANQSASGQAEKALATIARLRQLPPPQNGDARIALEEAGAAGALGDFRQSQQAAAAAATAAQAAGARLLVAQARVAEGWAFRNLGDPTRARSASEEALRLYGELSNRSGQALALATLAGAVYDQGDLAGAKQRYEEALSTYRDIGDQSGVARALNNIAVVARNQGDADTAQKLYEETLGICRETGDRGGTAATLNNEATLLVQQGRLGEAKKLLEDALALRRELADQGGAAYAISNLGVVLEKQGDLAAATARHEEALKIRREIGQRIGEMASLNNLGRVLLDQGSLPAARERFGAALDGCRKMANRSCEASALAGLGEAALAAGDLTHARESYEAALAIREAIGERQAAAESRQALAGLSLEEGEAPAAVAALAKSAAELAALGLPDAEALAHAARVRAALEVGDTGEAQRAATAAAALGAKSESRAVKIAGELAAGRMLAARGKRGQALDAFRAALADATAAGLLDWQFQARLAVGETEMAGADRFRGRGDLGTLALDAEKKGFGQIARRAARAARG